jgi:hypothetical protein
VKQCGLHKPSHNRAIQPLAAFGSDEVPPAGIGRSRSLALHENSRVTICASRGAAAVDDLR